MKTVLVTGATRGLGLAIASRLAKEKYQVIGVARKSNDEFDDLMRRTQTVFFEPFDLANIGEIHQWVRAMTDRYGSLFGLVNNAAVGVDGVLPTMHEHDINRVLAINLQSPIVLTKYVSRSMLIAGNGRIIHIASIIASTGFNGLSVYAASKAGLIGFSKSLARELGKGGITVNCIAPGFMETEMTKGIAPLSLDAIKRRSSMKRLASTDDVAGSVVFLLGDDARMITGATITVDGGSTA